MSSWPRLPVLVVGGIALAGLGFALTMGSDGVRPGVGAPVLVADLRFEDRLDGAVAVYANAAAQPTAMLAPGSNAFIRTTVRSLARTRRTKDTPDPEAMPFRLSLWPDGRLLLEDPATRRTLDLRAYGADNAQAFAQLLPAREGSR